MKILICSLAVVLSCAAFAADDAEVAPKPEAVPATTGGPANTRRFAFDCEKWQEGVPPKEVFVVDGTIKIAKKDGNKAIMIDPSPIVDASAQLGDSSNGTASIEARVFASKKGRSYPRFGVSVHGMSGYRLIVNCAKKEIELIKNEAVVKSAPFAWATDTWTRLKLEARQQDGKKWIVSAKAWPAGATEPAEALITHADDTIKGQGKAAIWGTPFSEMPIYVDDIKVEVTTK
ncbi:MAG: hypothetical protein JWO94_1930 [Verrucomicrobiaceae bacterium]|nr:hypothetical protein [Verrucomicrobiaceae bacterium]